MTQENFRKKKKYGQNFLVGDTVVRKIVAGSGITADCGVLEIGPWRGRADEGAARRGRPRTFRGNRRRADPGPAKPFRKRRTLSADSRRYSQNRRRRPTARTLRRADAPVCVNGANLPFDIAAPILMLLLEGRFGFRSITVMVQKEVAARLCAGKNDDCRGAITLAVQYYASVRRLFGVPAGCFSPPPKVDSAVVRMDPYPVPPVDTGDEKLFFTLIRAAFAQRRKTLLNALSAVFRRPRGQDAAGRRPRRSGAGAGYSRRKARHRGIRQPYEKNDKYKS